MQRDDFLDARGLSCPMPVVKCKKSMDQLKTGQILEVHATDKGSVKDIPAWAKSSGHTLLEQRQEDGIYMFWIQKG